MGHEHVALAGNVLELEPAGGPGKQPLPTRQIDGAQDVLRERLVGGRPREALPHVPLPLAGLVGDGVDDEIAAFLFVKGERGELVRDRALERRGDGTCTWPARSTTDTDPASSAGLG